MNSHDTHRRDDPTGAAVRDGASASPDSKAPPIGRRAFLKGGLVAIAAPMLHGCGDDPVELPPLPTFGSRLTARPGAPTVSPTLGLTELGLGTTRDGQLYIPTSYSPSAPAPLFVALHGAGGAGRNWESYHARAEARGMILLAPDSRGSTWDQFGFADGPDVAFIDRALEYTFARVRVDPTRICLAGVSDGASYTLFLGPLNGDLFTHLVAYSPGFFQEPDNPVGRPRIFISHGTADPILPVTNTRNFTVPLLVEAGYDVTYVEFAGGHVVPAEITESALDWFLGS